jgi:ketosteroid isomerase-like protein
LNHAPNGRRPESSTESQEHQKKEVAAAIHAFFEAGKNKDLGALADLHAPHEVFSKFDENPPYTRQNSQEAFVHEQASFSGISDYDYKIDDLRIDLIGETAVATFYLTYKGMFVNDYSFEGTPISSRARVTMVMSKTSGDWRIVHEHLSRFPDWAPRQDTTR